MPEESIVFLTCSENEAKTIAKELGATVGGFLGGAAGMSQESWPRPYYSRASARYSRWVLARPPCWASPVPVRAPPLGQPPPKTTRPLNQRRTKEVPRMSPSSARY